MFTVIVAYWSRKYWSERRDKLNSSARINVSQLIVAYGQRLGKRGWPIHSITTRRIMKLGAPKVQVPTFGTPYRVYLRVLHLLSPYRALTFVPYWHLCHSAGNTSPHTLYMRWIMLPHAVITCKQQRGWSEFQNVTSTLFDFLTYWLYFSSLSRTVSRKITINTTTTKKTITTTKTVTTTPMRSTQREGQTDRTCTPLSDTLSSASTRRTPWRGLWRRYRAVKCDV